MGAVHTTGVPHAFICRGICEPPPGTTTVPDPDPDPDPDPGPCDPALDYLPSATLSHQGDEVVARLTNHGCQPLYRWQGCCGEGDPLIERLTGGSWSAACDDPLELCCGALPTCKPLLPGETVELRVRALEYVDCCGTTFRVTYTFARDPSCTDDLEHPGVTARSEGVQLRDAEPCDGAAPQPTP